MEKENNSENKRPDEQWRGRFNPESTDPKNSTSLTIAGIVFIIVVTLFTILQ